MIKREARLEGLKRIRALGRQGKAAERGGSDGWEIKKRGFRIEGLLGGVKGWAKYHSHGGPEKGLKNGAGPLGQRGFGVRKQPGGRGATGQFLSKRREEIFSKGRGGVGKRRGVGKLSTSVIGGKRRKKSGL